MSFNQYDKNILLCKLKKAIEAIETMPVMQDCVSCKHADLGGVKLVCKLAGQSPPPEVLPVGCEAYVYDDLTMPF